MAPQDSRGGGDDSIMRDFIGLINNGKSKALSSAENSVASHLVVLVAGESRVSGKNIIQNEKIKNLA